MSNPDRGLFCIDQEYLKDIEIYGGDNDEQHQKISVLMVPCNYQHPNYPVPIHPECIADLEAQKAYLGAINWKIYHTQESFNPNGYGDETISKKSYLFNKQVDHMSPNWFEGTIQINEVADES